MIFKMRDCLCIVRFVNGWEKPSLKEGVCEHCIWLYCILRAKTVISTNGV